jgi:hypothetical protein
LSHLQLERGETPGSAGARFQQSRLRTLSFQARMSGQQLKGAAMWCKPIGKVRDMADQIKSHMLAAVVPAKGERWQLQEVPVPELLPTQVLVKVCASGISYADVEQTRGELRDISRAYLGMRWQEMCSLSEMQSRPTTAS